jgi:hypothetical protein
MLQVCTLWARQVLSEGQIILQQSTMTDLLHLLLIFVASAVTIIVSVIIQELLVVTITSTISSN